MRFGEKFLIFPIPIPDLCLKMLHFVPDIRLLDNQISGYHILYPAGYGTSYKRGGSPGDYYYYIIFHHLYPVDDFYDSVFGPDYQSI